MHIDTLVLAPVVDSYTVAKELFSMGDIRFSVSLLAINTLVLLGRVFEEFPRILTNSSYAALNYVGLTSIDYQFYSTLGNVRYFLKTLKSGNFHAMSYMGTSSFYKSVGLFFTVGGTVAATATLVQYTAIATAIYSIMKPFGIASIIANVGIEVSKYYMQNKAVKVLEETKDLDQLADICVKEDFNSPASDLLLTLDARTLAVFQEKLPEIQKLYWWSRAPKLKKLFGVTLDTMKKQQVTSTESLFETSSGILLRGLIKVYPAGKVEAIINWGCSTYWTRKEVLRAIDKIHNRHHMRNV